MSKKTFSERFKAARLEKGLKQYQIAEKVGFSTSLIGSWEKGKREPGLEALQKICEVLEKTPNDLLLESPEENWQFNDDQAKHYQSRLTDMRREMATLRQLTDSQDRNIETLESQVKNLEEHKNNLIVILEERDKEIERLNDALKKAQSAKHKQP
jgi:transcriptional regulator with XRE-family HTH domain